AFLLNAVLLLTLGGQAQALPLPRSVTTNMVLWLLPAVAGALASWDAVRLKREPYRRHYVSTHFGTSAAGMVLFFIVAFAIILLMQQSRPDVGNRGLPLAPDRILHERDSTGNPESGQLEGRADPARLPKETGST